MSNLYRTTCTFFCGLLLLVGQVRAQSNAPLWRPAAAPSERSATNRPTVNASARWFTLDAEQLTARLAPAPPETRPADAVPLELPFPDGTLHRFAVTRVPVLAPALAARYPQIQTYAGRSLTDPTISVRLETTPAGLHAQVLTPTGALSVLADPAAGNRHYQSRPSAPGGFECQALQVPGPARRGPGSAAPATPGPYGAQLRTLRLALAATAEYTLNLGGGTVAGTVGSMASLVSQANAVYERDLAVRLQLVGNTDQLVYLDAATDPYDNGNPTALMDANRAVVNRVIGQNNYDVGHVLGYTGGGYSGIAYIGVVCGPWPDYVGGGASTGASAGLMATVLTHEIGHQLGSAHTFNGSQGNCANGSRDPTMAFEPGAGNTIMSYDGRCYPDNVGEGIPYFHAGSIAAISSALSCGTLTATGNRPPSVSVPTAAYTIPQGTPFALAGSGTDPDGDALTYSWEELDRGDPSGLAGAATDPSGPPLFRSFAPVASPMRTFPALPAILNNTPSLGEILPLVARPLTFRLTARDNRGGGSGVAAATLTLAGAPAGPFRDPAPSAAFPAAPGSPYNVTWDVLGTDQAPVSCANVQVLFSTDGGYTFPTVLLASTPNTGAAQVQLPRLTTTKGRLKIQALDNVFFAINNANLTLAAPLPVELTAFTAETREASVHLAWATASERNNTGFAIEASADGTVFHRLGWANGHGTTSLTNSYQFDDGSLTAYAGPSVYYRLRQLDQDGTASFSPVRAVAVPTGRAAHLRVWPNPARTAVTVAGLAPGQLVQVLDLTGRVLLAAPLPVAGPLQLVLPSSLAPGIYVVHGGGQAQRLAVE